MPGPRTDARDVVGWVAVPPACQALAAGLPAPSEIPLEFSSQLYYRELIVD